MWSSGEDAGRRNDWMSDITKCMQPHYDEDDPVTFLFDEPTTAHIITWGMLAFLRPVAHDR